MARRNRHRYDEVAKDGAQHVGPGGCLVTEVAEAVEAPADLLPVGLLAVKRNGGDPEVVFKTPARWQHNQHLTAASMKYRYRVGKRTL